MTQETDRIIGAIQAMSEEHSRQLDKIFDRLDDMQRNGCAVGRQHSEDIKALQQRPEKAVALAGGAIGLISAIGSLAMWVWNHGKP